MLCVASLLLITFTRVLAVAVCHLTKNRFRPVIYSYAAALLYIPVYVLMYQLFGADLSLLGIYLPLLVVEPAIVKRMEFAELEPVSAAFRHGFNNSLGMCAALLIVGCLRELLATLRIKAEVFKPAKDFSFLYRVDLLVIISSANCVWSNAASAK